MIMGTLSTLSYPLIEPNEDHFSTTSSRLPPDGHEFPPSYQETSKDGSMDGPASKDECSTTVPELLKPPLGFEDGDRFDVVPSFGDGKAKVDTVHDDEDPDVDSDEDSTQLPPPPLPAPAPPTLEFNRHNGSSDDLLENISVSTGLSNDESLSDLSDISSPVDTRQTASLKSPNHETKSNGIPPTSRSKVQDRLHNIDSKTNLSVKDKIAMFLSMEVKTPLDKPKPRTSSLSYDRNRNEIRKELSKSAAELNLIKEPSVFKVPPFTSSALRMKATEDTSSPVTEDEDMLDESIRSSESESNRSVEIDKPKNWAWSQGRATFASVSEPPSAKHDSAYRSLQNLSSFIDRPTSSLSSSSTLSRSSDDIEGSDHDIPAVRGEPSSLRPSGMPPRLSLSVTAVHRAVVGPTDDGGRDWNYTNDKKSYKNNRRSLYSLLESQKQTVSKLRGLVIPNVQDTKKSSSHADLPTIVSSDSILAPKLSAGITETPTTEERNGFFSLPRPTNKSSTNGHAFKEWPLEQSLKQFPGDVRAPPPPPKKESMRSPSLMEKTSPPVVFDGDGMHLRGVGDERGPFTSQSSQKSPSKALPTSASSPTMLPPTSPPPPPPLPLLPPRPAPRRSVPPPRTTTSLGSEVCSTFPSSLPELPGQNAPPAPTTLPRSLAKTKSSSFDDGIKTDDRSLAADTTPTNSSVYTPLRKAPSQPLMDDSMSSESQREQAAAQLRILKANSVEAINRMNVLQSAKNSSGSVKITDIEFDDGEVARPRSSSDVTHNASSSSHVQYAICIVTEAADNEVPSSVLTLNCVVPVTVEPDTTSSPQMQQVNGCAPFPPKLESDNEQTGAVITNKSVTGPAGPQNGESVASSTVQTVENGVSEKPKQVSMERWSELESKYGKKPQQTLSENGVEPRIFKSSEDLKSDFQVAQSHALGHQRSVLRNVTNKVDSANNFRALAEKWKGISDSSPALNTNSDSGSSLTLSRKPDFTQQDIREKQNPEEKRSSETEGSQILPGREKPVPDMNSHPERKCSVPVMGTTVVRRQELKERAPQRPVSMIENDKDKKLKAWEGTANGEYFSKSEAPRRVGGTAGNSCRTISVGDLRQSFESQELQTPPLAHSTRPRREVYGSGTAVSQAVNHARVSSLDSTASESETGTPLYYGSVNSLASAMDHYGSVTSLASSTSLISQQELQQMIDEANQSLEESGTISQEVNVVVLQREIPGGSIGITLAGGADYDSKEITVNKVISGSIADRDGRIQKGDRVLSINGKSLRGVTHKDAQNILKAPRTDCVLVLSRNRTSSTSEAKEESEVKTRPLVRSPEAAKTTAVARIPATPEKVPKQEDIKGTTTLPVEFSKDSSGLGFSLDGGKDSPHGDRPLTIKKIFSGGAADKSGLLNVGDVILSVNGVDVTNMARSEAWNFMRKLPDSIIKMVVCKKS